MIAAPILQVYIADSIAPVPCAAQRLVTTSPDEDLLHDLSKDFAAIRYFPDYSDFEELRQLRDHAFSGMDAIYDIPLSDRVLRERVRIAGSIPRHVLSSKGFSIFKQELDDVDLTTKRGSADMGDSGPYGISHHFFAFRVKAGSYRRTGVSPVSSYALSVLINKFAAISNAELKAFIRVLEPSKQTLGAALGDSVATLISRVLPDANRACLRVSSINCTDLAVPPHWIMPPRVEFAQRVEQIVPQTEDVVWILGSCYTGIDAVVVRGNGSVELLQFTVNEKHSLKGRGKGKKSGTGVIPLLQQLAKNGCKSNCFPAGGDSFHLVWMTLEGRAQDLITHRNARWVDNKHGILDNVTSQESALARRTMVEVVVSINMDKI